MEEKDKAKEIFDKYDVYPLTHEWKKQCALIVVEEVLNIQCLSNGYAESCKHMKPHKGQRPYWEKVKEELEKL